MKNNKYKYLEKILKALANKRRLMILSFLKKEKEATVGTIAQEIKLSFRSTSRHLIVLFSAEIVEKEQRGTEAYYFLANKDTSRVVKEVLSRV